MIDISFRDVTKSYGAETVFSKLSFDIQTGQKVGLVGRNGCGKTTLLRCITGDEAVDSGSISIFSGKKVGYLSQLPRFPEGTTVRQVIELGLREQRALRTRMGVLADLLKKEPENLQYVREFGNLQSRFEDAGGYTEESEMFRVSLGLGIPKSMWEKDYRTLSGGEMTRVILASLLLERSEIMLLDEPTNHLDMHATMWLEDYLRSCKSTVLLVSHDRYFLDRVIERTFELEGGAITVYEGNYSFFADRKAENEAFLQKQREQLDREINRLSFTSDRLHGWGSGNKRMMHKAFALDKRIQRLKDMQPDKVKSGPRISGQMKSAERSGNDVLVLERLSKAFGEKTLFENLSLLVRRCESVCIMGENGCGKSTLLKILLGEEKPSSGGFVWGENIKTAYLPQKVVFPDESRTVLDEVMLRLKLSDGPARNRLAVYLFRGDDVFKPISVLSGGEKSRLMLCILLFFEVNLLILDEPTNHLDIYSREWVEELLEDYDGTLLFVSHDRYFIDRFATRIWNIESGVLTDYPGTYKAYVEKLKRDSATRQSLPERKPQPQASPVPKPREKNRSPETMKRRLQRDIAAAEREIEGLDARIQSLNAEMEEKASDYEALEQLSAELETMNGQSAAAYEKLDALMSELEELEQGS